MSAPHKERGDARQAGGSLLEAEAPENTRAPKMRHYLHPSDSAKYWCGTARTPGPIGRVGHHKPAECVVCHDMWIQRGTEGWALEAGHLVLRPEGAA